MKLGLTGGIACGKSTVADMLRARGAIIVDADAIAREVVLPGTPTLQQVAGRFGADILQADGSLDRKKLGAIIFNDPQARKDLEALLHPPIRALLRQRMEQALAERPDRLVVADIPLLYESQLAHMVDEVMVVYVPETLQRERLAARDDLPPDAVDKRLAAQMPIARKRELADIVIDNSGSIANTEEQVDAVWLARGWPRA